MRLLNAINLTFVRRWIGNNRMDQLLWNSVIYICAIASKENLSMLFSQRNAYKPIEKSFQFESIDIDLRNRLWNYFITLIESSLELNYRLHLLWLEYFKNRKDEYPLGHYGVPSPVMNYIKEYFFNCQWHEIYDIIEFYLSMLYESEFTDRATEFNRIMTIENSAYRLIDNRVVNITDKIEISEIQQAIEIHQKNVKEHIKRSIELLSDKKYPDYRNSIKESISAVESTCRYITDNKSSTLADCLKVIRKTKPIHPSLEQALMKLYGYTSDSSGIRT